jgi:FAD/FMN-containing dehydrogenase
MNAKTLDGRDFDLTAAMLGELRSRVRGPVLVPDEPGYEDARTVWNAMIDRRPAVVVRCLGTSDVIECVRFARQHSILLCIKSGGHNIAGLATADGALMIDLSLMRGVWVDLKKKVAHAQGGCTLGDVDRETQLHGLAAVLGFVSATGIAGLTLGGGFGYLTRRRGWTSDNVAGMDLVTADGKLVHASEKENPDLFWGLRGGGGNFGVVVGIDYRLYPVGPEVVGGVVAWPASEAPRVLELYRKLAAKAPPDLTLVTMMRPAPPAPWLPPEWHRKPIVAILACYTGKPEKGEKLVARIKKFRKPIGDILLRRPYTQLQSLLDGTQPKGRRYYWKSEYLAGVEPALLERLAAHAARIPSPHSAAIIFQLGDGIGKLPEEHSPVGNRDARYLFNLTSSWERAEDDAANIAWAREGWQDLRQFSTGGTYLNFLTEDEGEDRTNAALRGATARLAEIKRKWDPTNLFRANKNIRPA